MHEGSSLDRAIRAKGGYAELARILGVTRQTIYKWSAGRVPVERVVEVEKATGVPREQLRPDIFGAPV